MRESLKPGVESESTVVVTKEMSPPHLPTVVLSTPDMIRQIEGACLQLAQQHLDEGELTVGTHVCVSHTGAAFEGETVTIKVAVQEVNGRRITFAEEVLSPRGAISTGTHERAVVRQDRYKS